MKFILVILLSLVPVVASTSSLLFRAGYSLSTMIGSDSPIDGYSRAPEPGFSGSLGYAHSFKKVNGVVELSYLQKGVRYMDTEQSGIIVDLHYLELPLFVQYQIGNKDIRFIPGIGIAPAYLLSSKSFSYISGERFPIETRDIRNFDLSFIIELEISKQLSTGELALSIRPEISLLTNDPAGQMNDHSFSGLISIVYKLPIFVK